MEVSDPSLRTGAWIISLAKLVVSAQADLLVRVEFESVSLAGRSAMLLSALRSLTSVTANRLQAFRRSYELTVVEFNFIVDAMSQLAIADYYAGTSGDALALSVRPQSREDIYAFATYIFTQLQPSLTARIALAILDITTQLPAKKSDLLEACSTSFDSNEYIVENALKHLIVLGAVQETEETIDGEPLIHNPLFFQFRDQDTARILSALNSSDRDVALQIVDHVRRKPGIPVPLTLRGNIYGVLKQAGIIDVSAFTPRATEQPHDFPTLPYAWGKVVLHDDSEASADLVDDAKAFLSSIRYAEIFATFSGGRIWSPTLLLSALLSKGYVGPASNIGTDYPLIARRGIIDIVEDPRLPNRFIMELRKPEIVEPVLEILRDASATGEDGEGDAAALEVLNVYSPPEEGRRLELKRELREAHEAIIHESIRLRRR